MKLYDMDFNQKLKQAIQENWDKPAMTDYPTGRTLTYGKFAESMAQMHILFKEIGIEEGDKIAVVGKNNPDWAIVFLSAVTYGAVIVPILQNFPAADIHHIVNHSESKLLFISDNLKDQIVEDQIPKVQLIYCYDERYCIHKGVSRDLPLRIEELRDRIKKEYPKGFSKEDVKFAKRAKNDLFAIDYTSGTTGFSKGVMQTFDNIVGNIGYVEEIGVAYPGNRILSFLPLAHTYGCTLDLLSQITNGSHITFLNKLPAPKILAQAFSEVKPNVIFTVPLIPEKVFRAIAEPIIQKHAATLSEEQMEATVYPKVREMLIQFFGGEFKQVVMGGAALNAEIEDWLTKIKFPFAVGYGMTECSPLIAFVNLDLFAKRSVGRTLPNLEVKIDSEDPENIVGEVLVKGQNVMAGYYKNPEDTERAIDKDGWLHTGDLGTLSKNNDLFLKGRCKTMLLGPSGQNIYPEALEAKLVNLPFVSECLVLSKNNKLVALVYPDFKAMDELGMQESDLAKVMDENKKKFNAIVGDYERITEIILYPNAFEKTPKNSIKRYLYQDKI